MNEVDRALAQIADIRAQLAASTRFKGIAPGANVLTSALSLAVATAQSIWPESLARDALQYVAVWAAVIVVSTLIVTGEAISRSRRLHGRMADAMLGAALRQILPFAEAGVIITGVICRFAPLSAWMLPGLWQILIALVGFSALTSLPRRIVWAAQWYLICGAVVLCLAGWRGSLSPWMMGVPFVVGQAGVALILHASAGARDGSD